MGVAQFAPVGYYELSATGAPQPKENIMAVKTTYRIWCPDCRCTVTTANPVKHAKSHAK